MALSAQQDTEVLTDGAMSIEAAASWSGLSRTKIYAAMARGDLLYIKDGKRRLVPKRGLHDYLVSRLKGGS